MHITHVDDDLLIQKHGRKHKIDSCSDSDGCLGETPSSIKKHTHFLFYLKDSFSVLIHIVPLNFLKNILLLCTVYSA